MAPITTNSRSPKYRLHKARNCAVVTVDGRDHYLGIFGSPQSWEQYHRLVAESLAANTRAASTILPLPADAPLTVTELIAKYWLYSKGYYVKNGKPTSDISAIKLGRAG